MRKELAECLKEFFPIFSRAAKDGPFEARGFECDEGWYTILDRFGRDLTLLRLRGIKVVQIKQGLGGLRITLRYPFWLSKKKIEKAESVVLDAELASYKTCEACGGRGCRRELTDRTIIRCDMCFKSEPRP